GETHSDPCPPPVTACASHRHDDAAHGVQSTAEGRPDTQSILQPPRSRQAHAATSTSSGFVPVRGKPPSGVTSMVWERQTPYCPATRSDMGRWNTMPASRGAGLSVRMKKPRPSIQDGG